MEDPATELAVTPAEEATEEPKAKGGAGPKKKKKPQQKWPAQQQWGPGPGPGPPGAPRDMTTEAAKGQPSYVKLFIGKLPGHVGDMELGDYFSRYGPVAECNIMRMKGKPPYAFVLFRNPADADCAVLDDHSSFGPIDVSFATQRPPDILPQYEDMKNPWLRPEGADTRKVFCAGIGAGDTEEEIGDYFTQWGLVAMVQKVHAKGGKDKGFGFIFFATESGPMRVMMEPVKPKFRGKHLDIKWRIPKNDSEKLNPDEFHTLKVRAVQRHFQKIAQYAPPPPEGPFLAPPPPHALPPPHKGFKGDHKGKGAPPPPLGKGPPHGKDPHFGKGPPDLAPPVSAALLGKGPGPPPMDFHPKGPPPFGKGEFLKGEPKGKGMVPLPPGLAHGPKGPPDFKGAGFSSKDFGKGKGKENGKLGPKGGGHTDAKGQPVGQPVQLTPGGGPPAQLTPAPPPMEIIPAPPPRGDPGGPDRSQYERLLQEKAALERELRLRDRLRDLDGLSRDRLGGLDRLGALDRLGGAGLGGAALGGAALGAGALGGAGLGAGPLGAGPLGAGPLGAGGLGGSIESRLLESRLLERYSLESRLGLGVDRDRLDRLDRLTALRARDDARLPRDERLRADPREEAYRERIESARALAYRERALALDRDRVGLDRDRVDDRDRLQGYERTHAERRERSPRLQRSIAERDQDRLAYDAAGRESRREDRRDERERERSPRGNYGREPRDESRNAYDALALREEPRRERDREENVERSSREAYEAYIRQRDKAYSTDVYSAATRSQDEPYRSDDRDRRDRDRDRDDAYRADDRGGDRRDRDDAYNPRDLSSRPYGR